MVRRVFLSAVFGVIAQGVAAQPGPVTGLGAGHNGFGPDGQDIMCETPDLCDNTTYLAIPSPPTFPEAWTDYTITPADGFLPNSKWMLTGFERPDIPMPPMQKAYISWNVGSTRPIEGASPDECTGVIAFTDPNGDEVAKVDANNPFRMDINLDGAYMMEVQLNDKCLYWHATVYYHSVHPEGGRRRVITSCQEGKFSLEMMVHVEHSYNMLDGTLDSLKTELPALIDSLAPNFEGGVKVGMMSFGDKPVEPHGQPDVDYCLGTDTNVGLFVPLAPLGDDIKNKVSQQLDTMKQQVKSGRDYMEDVLGALHYTALTTPYSPTELDTDGNRNLRINLVITDKLWHEAGDSQVCTCKDDKWSEYDCIQWECAPANLPPHTETAANDKCLDTDYLSKDQFASAMKMSGVNTLIYLHSPKNSYAAEAYESLAQYMRRNRGVNFVAATSDAGSLADAVHGMLDSTCVTLQQDDWNREDACKDTISFPFLPIDVLDDDNGPMYQPGYTADKIRQKVMETFPPQPFILQKP